MPYSRVGRVRFEPFPSVDLLGEPVEDLAPAGEHLLGARPPRCAEEVTLGQARDPALELLPIGLALLELGEPEPLLARLATNLVLEAFDTVDDLLVLGVAGGVEVGDEILLPRQAR